MRHRRPSIILLITSLLLAGCEREITSGQYGPLKIGQSKSDALAALIDHGIEQAHVSPEVYERHYITDPSRLTMDNLLSDEAGILVWIGGRSSPLRIEFGQENLVSNKWPDFPSASEWAPEDLRAIDREMARLTKRIEIGDSRDTVFDTLANFETSYGMAVGNFVVGYHAFHIGDGESRESKQYQELLLANDAWEFDGLEEELWYDPFYSQITVYFRDNKVERIRHQHFPTELP